MKIPSLPFGAAILAVVVVLFTLSAHADTFAIYDLGGANSSGVYGITASGDVVIDNSECFLVPIPCYYINYRGAVIGTSMTPPALTYDNGYPCTGCHPASTQAAPQSAMVPTRRSLDSSIPTVTPAGYTLASRQTSLI
jgi:hypothetical protein